MLNSLLDNMAQGLIWAILALGVYISYRILDFADLTCEGCITLGASVAATMIYKTSNPWLAIIVAFIAGCIAGMLTGVLHTKLKIPPILAGILTMISLFSINIRIMSIATGTDGTANLSLLKYNNSQIYTQVRKFFSLFIPDITKTLSSLIIGVVICVAIMALLYCFFGTELGSAIRATGTNEKMCRAQGINTDTTKIIGLALSNGLIALCGAFLCQYQGASEVNMGVGAIVIGLASIIIGEAIFAKSKNFFITLTGITVGSVIYRIVVGLIIYFGSDIGVKSSDLKLMTAIVVIIALEATNIMNHHKKKKNKNKSKITREGGKVNV